MHWFRRIPSQLTAPARRLAALSVLLITVTILLAGCGGGASGVSSGIAPYMMALWLFGLSAVSLFFTGCGGENNGVPGFGQSTVSTSSGGGTSSTSGGPSFQATPTSLTFGNTPGSIAQPVSHAATALTKLPPVQVEILDQNGHLDTSATNLVTISLGANPSHATLKGTLTKAAVGGIATFDDLEITLAGSGFTLVASSPGLKGATSASFNVSALPVNLAYIDRQDYEVDIEPVAVALVDLKGDGSKDLITANYYYATISVIMGNGDGSFQSAVNYDLPKSPTWIVAADVNGDGHPDVVVNYYYGQISVLLGNGNGTFQSPITKSTPDRTVKFAVGDFNGDKVPDLVMVSESEAFILIGNGDGTFQNASYVNASYTGCDGNTGIVAGDFNQDGALDIALLDYCGQVEILLGNGDGKFQFASFAPFSGESDMLDIASGDFNGDGKPDLAVADYFSSVHVWLGNGDGTFQSPLNYDVPSNTQFVAVGDVDGDGNIDVVTSNRHDDGVFPQQTVSVLLGKGDGTFRTSINYEAGEDAEGIAVGDVNNDGKADVAVANDDSSIASVFLGAQAGLLSPAAPLPLPFQFTNESSTFNNIGPSATAIADVNGDGIPDIVVASKYGTITTFLGLGGGTFQAPINFSLEPISFPPPLEYDLNLVDLNGDGHLDLVVANPGPFGSGHLSVALGNGDGTFQHARQITPGEGKAEDLAVGDFNKDGIPDLAVTDNGGHVQILLGNGDGTFQNAVNYSAAPNSAQGITVGDFNGDGNLDIAVANYNYDNGVVSVLLGNGNGSFQSPTTVSVGDHTPQGITSADVNGDGKLDLITVNYFDSVSVMLGNGDGTFQAGVCHSIGNPALIFSSFGEDGNRVRNIVAADVNADGIPDIVVPQRQECNVKVLVGNGDGTFQSPISLGTGADPLAVAVGDLNGDGKVDFITADKYGDTATLIFHQ